MFQHHSSSLFSAGLLAGVVALTLSLLTGCGIGTTLPASGDVAPEAITFSGLVHGGQNPVYNSTIGIWAAGVGSSGYGAGSTNLLAGYAAVKTNASGGFSIPVGDTYLSACQSGNDLVYVTASGGDPTDNTGATINNSAIELVAVVGPCSSLSSSTYLQINEVTTVAAAYALGQFFGGFGGTDAVGAPSSNANGLSTAFATGSNLACGASSSITPNGSAGPCTATVGSPATTVSMTSFDGNKMNLIADILADCVNQTTNTAAACISLFSAVVPYYAPLSTTTRATAPTDTFQAAVYMSLNPTSNNSGTTTSNSSTNMATLVGLASGYAPFTTSLTGAPTDWTLALQYSQTNLTYTSSVAVDSYGDLWFTDASSTGGLFHMSGGTGLNGGTAGVMGSQINFTTGSSGEAANGARQVAIDQSGNAWWSGYSTNYFYKTSSSGSTTTGISDTISTLPYAVAIDGNNQTIFSTANSYTISFASGSVTPAGENNIGYSAGAASIAITSGASPTAYAPAKGGSGIYYFATNPIPTAQTGGVSITDSETANYGAAVDSSNTVWVVNESATGALAKGNSSGFTAVAANSGTPNCLATPQFVAVDGNNNIWVSNSTTQTATSEGGSSITFDGVCEFNNSGTLISSNYGFGPHNIATGRGIAIDLAGNVWVTSYATTSTNVTEIVGAGVPAVAPLSTALKNATVGTRP